MNKKEIEKGKVIVDKIVHKITLKMFKVGCDTTNFEMLGILSEETQTSELKEKLDLSSMGISRRTNALFEAGLILKSKAGYVRTDLGTHLLDIIDEIKKEVKKELPNLIK